jgi:hypothetical protein
MSVEMLDPGAQIPLFPAPTARRAFYCLVRGSLVCRHQHSHQVEPKKTLNPRSQKKPKPQTLKNPKSCKTLKLKPLKPQNPKT